MESRESQRDKRVQDVIQGRPAGGGNSPAASAMRAREEIQGIEAERAANLERQKIIGNTRQQQIATMKQAALLGASGMAAADGGAQVSPVAQQAAAMNPQTQAILQKYGVKPGPRTTMSSTQQSGPNIRTTNTTTNNVRNEIRIVQPQIPMRQQQIPIGAQGKSGNLDKFKAWLDSSFAKQANEYEVQQKEYRKREWNLARNSSKLFQKLSESTKSLGEKMDPKNVGTTFGGQLKTLLFLFLATTINKWWNPLMKRIEGFEAGFRAAFGLPMNEDLRRSGAGGLSFIDKIKEFIGIDVKTQKGKNTSLIEGFYNVIMDGVDRIEALLKNFIEDRRIALQKIDLPEINIPQTDWNPLGKLIGSAFKGVMGPTTEYLGRILGAIMGGTKGLQKGTAHSVNVQAREDFKKDFGGKYYTSESTDLMGNLKSDSTYGMSMIMSRNLQDKSNVLHTGGLMTGMKMLEGSAKKSGGAVVDPGLLRQLGFGENVISKMIQSGQAEYCPMKIIRVTKSEAEREDFSGGSMSSYIGNEILDDMSFGIYGKLTGWGARKAAMNSFQAARAANKAGLGRAYGVLRGAGRAAKVVGRAAGPLGWLATLGGGVVGGIRDYINANEGNSAYVYKAVPMSDRRPGEAAKLLRITPEGFNALKKEANIKSFDTDDSGFQRWIEGIERSKKAIMRVKGKLTYRNSMMENLNQISVLAANSQAERDRIINDPNYTGRGGVGNIPSVKNNTAIAIANGMSWAANGLNDIKFRLTGKISPLHIPAGEARRNAERGIRYLMEKYGLSKEAAAGIAGVIQRESGWNPGAQNLSEKSKGYKGFGRGLCQWSNNWGTKDFPEWYLKTHGERKYPDEVPLEHQLDYLMTGLAENGIRKEEFLQIIHKPGVTVEEAARAMFLGYENGGQHLASFSDLANVKAYGGVAGVSKMYTDRASAALGFYNNVLGGGSSAGYNQTSSGEYTLDEDASENPGAGIWKTTYKMSKGSSGWDLGSLKLADAKDIAATIIGQDITDDLKLGDWFVGRSIKYLAGNAASKPTGYCARHVRLALKAGGISDKNHPAAATDYLGYLPSRGFARIPEGSRLQPGDICIQPAGGTHRYGHICMFTGQKWVSDFVQTNMIVYKGNWPYVLFRYTGKGGSGTDSAIDAGMNYIKDAVDTVGNVAGKVADGLAAGSDYINPNGKTVGTMDTESLTTKQMATYRWAKMMEGVKEDETGLYVDDKSGKYRHYIDLNSGISKTGFLTQDNFLGTYRLRNGIAYEAVNDTYEADTAQNSILSTMVGKYLKQTGSGRILDYTLPGTYGSVGTKREWPIKYNIYDIDSNGAAYNTILIPTIPVIDKSGFPKYNGREIISSPRYNGYNDEELTRYGKVIYPKEYELTGTPKEGWSILYSREKKIKSDVSGSVKSYTWSPWLHGESCLGIGIAPEAMDLILDIMRMIRGEIEVSKELEDKIGDLRKEIMKHGKEVLEKFGINEDSIKKSIETYKGGKEKDRYKSDINEDVIDTKLGITIKKGDEFIDPKKFVNRGADKISEDINNTLNNLTALRGEIPVTAETSYNRYKLLHANNVFDDKESVDKIKKGLAGDLGYSVGAKVDPTKFPKSFKPAERDNPHGYGIASPILTDSMKVLERSKYKAILDESGQIRYVLDKKSLSENDLTLLNSSEATKNIYGQLINGGFTKDELEKKGIKVKDNKSIGWGSVDEIAKSGLFKREDILRLQDDASIELGLRKTFEDESTARRIKHHLDEYKKSKDNGTEKTDGYTIENGFVVHTDPKTGRKEAFGKVTEKGVIGINNSKEYTSANFGYIKSPSQEALASEYRDKVSWYASKFGAKVLDAEKGRMYIEISPDRRFVFNVNQLGPNDDLERVMEVGTYFNKVNNGTGDVEYFGKDWANTDTWEHTISSGTSHSTGVNTGYNVTGLTDEEKKRYNDSLRAQQEAWNSTQTDKSRREAFNNSWNNAVLEERLAGINAGGIDESNSYLGSIEDISKSQLDLLAMIAENTATKGEDGKISADAMKRIKDYTDKIKTTSELREEKSRDKYIRDVFHETLRIYGETYRDQIPTNGDKLWMDARRYAAQHLGVSEEEVSRASGLNSMGGYSAGIMYGLAPGQRVDDYWKAKGKVETTNAQNIAAQAEGISEISSAVADQNAENSEFYSENLKNSSTIAQDLKDVKDLWIKFMDLDGWKPTGIYNSGNNTINGGSTYTNTTYNVVSKNGPTPWDLGQPKFEPKFKFK